MLPCREEANVTIAVIYVTQTANVTIAMKELLFLKALIKKIMSVCQVPTRTSAEVTISKIPIFTK